MATGNARFALRLLGLFELRLADGVPVDVGSRRGRALVAFLALHRHREVSRDELVGALWPDGGVEDPQATLSTLLSRLRRTVGTAVLPGGGAPRLMLPPDAAIDVEALAAHVDDAEAALAADRCADALRAAGAAEAVAAGPLLPELDAAWATPWRARFDELAATALELQARAGLRLGGEAAAGAARAAAGRLTTREPFRESGWILLMRALQAQGDDAEALRAFERLRLLLRDELGTRPSTTVRALHAEVLAGTNGPAGPPAPAVARGDLPALARADRVATLVGREAELAALDGHWAALDRPALVVLDGEAGIGKTTLAAEWAHAVHARGALVLWGRCDEQLAVPFQPVAEALRGCDPALVEAATRAPETTPARRLLAADAGRASGPPDAEADRLPFFDAVAGTVDAMAGGRPVLLVVDDLQWADRSTLLLLRHLLRDDPGRRLLVLATRRQGQHADAAGSVLEDGRWPGGRVALGGLSVADANALLSAATRAPADPALAARWHARTSGHPLFLRQLVASGSTPAADAEVGALPDGLRALLQARITALDPQLRAVLRTAAVLGREFDLPLLAELAGLDVETTLDALERAMALGLVAESPTVVDAFGFGHELLREALEADQANARRIRTHAHAAQRMAAHARPDRAAVAHHAFAGRTVLGAAAAARACAEAAAAASFVFADDEAAEHFRRGLVALDAERGAGGALRCDLLLGLGATQWRTGDPAAEGTFALARTTAEALGDARRGARAALGGRHLEATADPARRARLQAALERLGGDDDDLRVELLARLAAAQQLEGLLDEALANSAAALALATAVDDPHVTLAALTGRHAALMDVEHLDERVAVLDRLAAEALDAGDLELAAYGTLWSVHAALERGEIETARGHLQRFLPLADRLGRPELDHYALGARAVFAQLDGDPATALRLTEQGFALADRIPGDNAMRQLAAQHSLIRRELGDHAGLAEVTRLFVNGADGASWRAGCALALALGGDATGARELIEPSARVGFADVPRGVYRLTTLGLFAEAASVAGEAPGTDALATLLEPHAERHVQILFSGHLGTVHRLLGLLAAGRGDAAEARRRLELALARHEAAGAPALIARSRAELASGAVAVLKR